MATEESTNKADEQLRNEEFKKLIETPLTQADAEKELANNDINRMQLMTIRQKWQTQIMQLQLQTSNLDEQLRALEMERAVIFRRTLNNTEDTTPENGEEASSDADKCAAKCGEADIGEAGKCVAQAETKSL